MARIKIVEIILSAVSALVAAAKSIIKFIACIVKMKSESEPEPTTSTA